MKNGTNREPVSTAVVDTRAEHAARIDRVLWATPLAADIEPWTTPGRVTANIAPDGVHGR